MSTVVICAPTNIQPQLLSGRRPFCVATTSASSSSQPISEVIHSGAAWPCRIKMKLDTGPGAQGILTLQFGLVGLHEDVHNVIGHCPTARIDIPLSNLQTSVAVWLGLEFLDAGRLPRPSHNQILQKYEHAVKLSRYQDHPKVCVLLKHSSSTGSAFQPSPVKSVFHPSPIKAQSEILNRSFGAMSLESFSNMDITEISTSSNAKQKSSYAMSTASDETKNRLELLPTPRLREELQRLKERKIAHEQLEKNSLKAATALVEGLQDQLRDLGRIKEELDIQAKKAREDQETAQHVLRNMISEDTEKRKHEAQRQEKILEEKSVYVNELAEKHRILSQQQDAARQRLDNEMRHSQNLENEFNKMQKGLHEAHRRMEVAERAALEGAHSRCGVEDLEADGDYFQREQDAVDELEMELERIQKQRDKILNSPQTARRARLTEASKMEAEVTKIEEEINVLSKELEQVNSECEDINRQLAQERDQGEILVQDNLSKVTEEEKNAAQAMQKELEDYLRDEVRPLQAQKKQLQEENEQVAQSMKDEISEAKIRKQKVQEELDEELQKLQTIVKEITGVEIATEEATKLAQAAGATPDLPQRIGDALREEQALLTEINESAIDECQEIKKAEEKLAEMKSNLSKLEQRCQELDDEMSAAARRRQQHQQALFEAQPPKCAESPPKRRFSRVNSRTQLLDSSGTFSFTRGRSKSPVPPSKHNGIRTPPDVMRQSVHSESSPKEVVSALRAARSLVSKNNQFSASQDTVRLNSLHSTKNVYVKQDVTRRMSQTKRMSRMSSVSSLPRTLKPEYYESHRSTNCESPTPVTRKKNAMQQEYSFAHPEPRDSNESLPMPTPYYSARETPTGEHTHIASDVYSETQSEWSPKKGRNDLEVRSPSPTMQSMPVQQRAAAATANLHQRMRNRIAEAIQGSSNSKKGSGSGSSGNGRVGGASSSKLHDTGSARSSRASFRQSPRRETASSRAKKVEKPFVIQTAPTLKRPKSPVRRGKTVWGSPLKSSSPSSQRPEAPKTMIREAKPVTESRPRISASPVRPCPSGPPAQPKSDESPPSIQPQAAPALPVMRKSAAFLHPAHANRLFARPPASPNEVPVVPSNSPDGRPIMAVRKSLPQPVPGQVLQVVRHRPPFAPGQPVMYASSTGSSPMMPGVYPVQHAASPYMATRGVLPMAQSFASSSSPLGASSSAAAAMLPHPHYAHMAMGQPHQC